MPRSFMITSALALAVLTTCAALPVSAAEVRPGVEFAGTLETAGTPRANMQDLVLDLASSWASCNPELIEKTLSADVKFSYPTSQVDGIEAVKKDLALFCDAAKDTSIYLPADAFYIDAETGRVAAELQFRTFQRGNRQSVNDVWVATITDDRITVIKEYLDGRVKNLQAQGILELEESPEFLTPWPARTPAWKDCFPILKVEPTNSCPAPK